MSIAIFEEAGAASVLATVNGVVLVYIPGAPPFVNAAFVAAFADGVPPGFVYYRNALAFARGEFVARRLDSWLLAVDEDPGARPFLSGPHDVIQLMFSPDGNWIAYVSNESGASQVYVQPYPGPGPKRQISTQGGAEPRWSADMSELFYREGERMMVVDVLAREPSFEVGKPSELFQGPYEMGGVRPGFPNYDVTRDGQRFLMIKKDKETAPPERLHVVLNWFEELKRLVPTDN